MGNNREKKFLLLNRDGSLQFIDPVDHVGSPLLRMVVQLDNFTTSHKSLDPSYPQDEWFMRPVAMQERIYQRVRTDIDLNGLILYVQRD